MRHLLLYALLLLAPSCVFRDRSDCPPPYNVRVAVIPDVHKDTRAAAADRFSISRVCLYVFDQQGCFVDYMSGGALTLGAPYTFDLKMEPGLYHFAVFTNHDRPYYTVSHTLDQLTAARTEMRQVKVRLDHTHFGPSIDRDLADMHSGTAIATVPAVGRVEVPVTIIPNTYRLNFRVVGLPKDTREYLFRIEDSPIEHDFTGSKICTAQNERFAYTRTTSFAAEAATAEPDVLKTSGIVLGLDAMEHTAPRFSLTRDGEQLYEGDLRTLIADAHALRYPGERPDFKQLFEFTVPLVFDVHLGITLDVDAWTRVPNDKPLR